MQVVKDLSDYNNEDVRLEGQFTVDGVRLLISDSSGYVTVYSCAEEALYKRTHEEQVRRPYRQH